MKATRDESLEEIWEIRRQIAKKFDFDPKKQVAHYQQKQKRLGAKLYRPEVQAGSGHETPIALHDCASMTTAASKSATPASYRTARKRKTKPVK